MFFPDRNVPLTPDQIQRLARLARIAVSAAEADAVRARINRVLQLIDELQSVDTRGIEPMAHALDTRAAPGQRLRADEVTEADRHAEYQAAAPAVARDLYLVPRVIE